MVTVRRRRAHKAGTKSQTPKSKRRDTPKKISFGRNPVLRAHWDNKLSFKENFKRLGIQSRLAGPSGGVRREVKTWRELKKEREAREAAAKVSIEAIENETDPLKIPLGEARIIRDPDTNEVVQVIQGTMQPADTSEPQFCIADELKAHALATARVEEERPPDERDLLLAQRLTAKYGDNYRKMAWDRKLNPMYYTEEKLEKLVAKWRELGGR